VGSSCRGCKRAGIKDATGSVEIFSVGDLPLGQGQDIYVVGFTIESALLTRHPAVYEALGPLDVSCVWRSRVIRRDKMVLPFLESQKSEEDPPACSLPLKNPEAR
jgi:hypothetical protein